VKIPAPLGSELLADVVRQATESIVVTDLDGNIEYVNPAFERVTGYAASEVLGRNPRILRSESAIYPRAFYEEMWKTICSGTVWRGEFTNRRKDGSVYVEEAVIFPVRDPVTAQITRFGAVKTDVTRRKELEARLRSSYDEMVRLKEQAEQANRAKSEFVAHMSHEIRTPLNGIIGFLELLARTRLDDTQADFVRLVRRSAQNLLAIINDVLDLAKIEAGRLELEQVAFDPRQELESIVDLFGSGASEKSIHFYCFIDPALPPRLVGDPLRIKQVLANFVSNALKFTPEGRLVSVEVRPSPTGASPPGRCRIVFSVSDEGIGIAKDKQRTILEAFAQADSSVSRKFGGTGLGLTISHRLITQMGGVLDLESDEGKGSRFRFELELPIAEAATGGEASRPRVALVHGGPAALEHLVREYLEGLRCDTTGVSTPAEVASGSDAIVMVHSGGDRESARAFSAAGIPVLLIAEPAQRAEVEPLGVSRVLYTPLHGSRLSDALAAVRAARGGERPAAVDAGLSALPQARGRALVAEDNAVNQKLITYMLRAAGLEADVAADGEQAVAMFASGSYDIVFMDASMPVADGLEATRRIRALEREQGRWRTPIVALTAHAVKGDRERFLASGMDDYLPKPIDVEALTRLLARRL
jgi:two-component system, sensor histidine kinase and response regulator